MSEQALDLFQCAPAAWHNLARVLLTCRMRHVRRYAEYRIVPNRHRATRAWTARQTRNFDRTLAKPCNRSAAVGAKKLAPSTINVRLAAVRRLAYEAVDTGLLSPELVADIRRVKGVPQLGRRVGNWLGPAEGERLLSGTSADNLQQKRDAAIISVLLGCGLRRSEGVGLAINVIQKREDHWAIVLSPGPVNELCAAIRND